MRIAFYSNQLSERGTETALIDYAVENERILHNQSVLIFPKNKILDKHRFELLSHTFEIFLFENIDELNSYLKDAHIDLFYCIVPGRSEDIADKITTTKTFVHSVFDLSRKHGDIYSAIHPYLNKAFHTDFPVLPHIVKKCHDTQETLRKELCIPNDALVFGSYAGKDRFDIQLAHEAIKKVAKSFTHTNKIFFLFMNIDNFIEKECPSEQFDNIIFLPGSTDLEYKQRFINTCNAMIHARSDGETFGLSIGEFSISGKPVITYKPGLLRNIKSIIKWTLKKHYTYAKAHIMNLGKKGIYYSSKRQLEKILTNSSLWGGVSITPPYSKNYYDCFSEKFSAEKVMAIFNKLIHSIDKGA